MLPRLVVLLAALSLAGCASPAPPDTNESAATSPTSGAPPEVTSIPISRAAATPVGEPDDAEQGEFVVGPGANETLVEARWTCADPSCGFVVLVYDEGGNEVASDDGSGEVTITEVLARGTYTAAVASTGPAVNMQGEIRVSVFEGAVPEGYSAFDA